MIRRFTVLTLSTAMVVGACTDQSPTAIGGDLIRGGDVYTAEVVLDAAEFLEGSESFSGFTRTEEAAFTMIAREFGGVVDAHALVRFPPPPTTVTYDDADGETQTDSLPTYIGGEVVVNVDSTRTATEVPVELEVRRIAETWDAGSATWAVRIDSGDVRESWTEPGGTTDAVLGTAVWEPGDTLVRIPVDSQTVAAWADSEGETPELLVASRTAGVRIFGSADDPVELELRARPSERPDTVVTTSLGREAAAFLFDPPADAAPGRLRVGGTPAWRSFLRFRDRLDTLTLQVQADSGTLSVPLGDATVNYASVLLQPAPVAAGYAPEDSLVLRAHRVLPADGVPLARSAVETNAIGESRAIPRSVFGEAAADPAELPITSFVQGLAEPADSAADDTPSTDLAVLSPHRRRFGFGAFTAAGAEPTPPRLRLIVTIATEIELE